MQRTRKELELEYDKVETEIISFIRKTVKGASSSGAVVGLSGGIDSAVVGALLVRALGKAKVVGILMPASHTPKQDTEDARAMAKAWGIRTYEIGIDRTFSALEDSVPGLGNERIARANVKARIRMVINYYVANSLNMLVAGTGDRSEDLIGFFTKFGDGGVDFLPIAHLYKTQVRALGAHLGLPEGVVMKPSSPQLWPGHKAVDELPVDYDKLDLILAGFFDKKMSAAQVARSVGVERRVVEEVLKRHRASAHKRSYPPMLGSW